jgi:hypothetical protein
MLKQRRTAKHVAQCLDSASTANAMIIEIIHLLADMTSKRAQLVVWLVLTSSMTLLRLERAAKSCLRTGVPNKGD